MDKLPFVEQELTNPHARPGVSAASWQHHRNGVSVQLMLM